MNIDFTPQDLDFIWRCILANERQKNLLAFATVQMPFSPPPCELLAKVRAALDACQVPRDPITVEEGQKLLARIRGCEPEDWQLEIE